MRINNKVFSHLYTLHKTNTEFKREEDEVKDIKISIGQLNPNKQKIQVNIAGMSKKKKEVSGGAEGWNAFSGGEFPNYFGGSTTKEEEKPAVAPKVNLLEVDEKTEAESTTTEATKVEMNLLGDFSEPKPATESIFEIEVPAQVPSKSPADDFNTMQDMFTTVNVSPQPATNSTADFFAEEPKKEVAPVVAAKEIPTFDYELFSNTEPE